MAVVSRFLIDLRLEPRHLATGTEAVAARALCLPAGSPLPLRLVGHPQPYPSALVQVFSSGRCCSAAKRRRGRKKNPGLRPPTGFLAGVVEKVGAGSGRMVTVRARSLCGRLQAVHA